MQKYLPHKNYEKEVTISAPLWANISAILLLSGFAVTLMGFGVVLGLYLAKRWGVL